MPDPDDELPLDSLDTLFNNTSDEVDLLCASYIMYKNGVYMNPKKQSIDMELSRDELVSLMGIFPQPRNIDRRCCNKLFRASIIKDNGVFFPEDLQYREDILYNYLFLNTSVRRIKCISYNMYIYNRRDTGAAISNQMIYTPKSGGLFLAMTRCYDILDQMNVSRVTKNRMKDEMYDTYRAVIRLIDRSGLDKKEKRIYSDILSQYFCKVDLCLIGFRRLYNHYKQRIIQ